jgi:hypothetical protein
MLQREGFLDGIEEEISPGSFMLSFILPPKTPINQQVRYGDADYDSVGLSVK